MHFKKGYWKYKRFWVSFGRGADLPEGPTVNTYGSASIMGKAVSWILDGLLKPMPYTPWSSCGFLETKK